MICENCGNWVEDGASNCPGCGAPVMAQGAAPGQQMNMGQSGNGMPGGGQPAGGMVNGNPSWSGYSEPGLGRMAFYKHPNVSYLRKQLAGCGIGMYILAALNGVLYAVTGDIISAVIAVVLFAGLGLGIHLGQSRVCAILLTVYGTFNVIVTVMETGRVSGWLFLLVGIYGLIYTFKFHKAWKQYKKTGIIPFVGGK